MGGRVEDRLARRGGTLELLRLPAWVFAAAVRLRGALYDRRLLPIRKLDTPVVSVGNLTTGGTGKTPMVAWIVRHLKEQGLRPAILSRGYRREGNEAGDEARLLERLLPGVPHEEDPDRVAGGRRLQDRGADVIVLDDGFQHRRLARDLDVVLVDATRPWGLPAPEEGVAPVRALLPRGLLREPTRALGRADVVVVTRSDGVVPEELAALRAELARLAPRAPIVLASHAPTALRELDGETLYLGRLRGLEVDLVSGIGNPAAFETTVVALGATVATHRVHPDHHRFAAQDFDGLGERPVVVTGKDEPKLLGLPFPDDVEPWVLDVELALVEGADALRGRLDGLPEGQRRRERRALHEGLHG